MEKLYTYVGALVIIYCCITVMKNLVHTFRYDIRHGQYHSFIESLMNYATDVLLMTFFAMLGILTLIMVIYISME